MIARRQMTIMANILRDSDLLSAAQSMIALRGQVKDNLHAFRSRERSRPIIDFTSPSVLQMRSLLLLKCATTFRRERPNEKTDATRSDGLAVDASASVRRACPNSDNDGCYSRHDPGRTGRSCSRSERRSQKRRHEFLPDADDRLGRQVCISSA